MMSVKDYAMDTNHSIAEVLKKCHELNIDVSSGDDMLSDDDIIMLDNTMNLISTTTEASLDEEDIIDEAVDELILNNEIDKQYKEEDKTKNVTNKIQD